MIIEDKRRAAEPIKFSNLQQGIVYIDAYGDYVFATSNSDFVVDLMSGEVINDGSYYAGEADSFTPVNAKLEIYS